MLLRVYERMNHRLTNICESAVSDKYIGRTNAQLEEEVRQ